MRGLIGCEVWGLVRDAFNERGHTFQSVDILPCSGKNPELHIQDDIFHALHKCTMSLDFLGSHWPCQFLANSGVRWLASVFPREGYEWNEKHQIFINPDRWEKMERSAIGFRSLYHNTSRVGKGYLENPIMHKYAMEIIGVKPTQIIQPWQFGHGETKATCLWLINLPELVPTDIVEGREPRIHMMPPGDNRTSERSKTYSGIAKAMAEQWG